MAQGEGPEFKPQNLKKKKKFLFQSGWAGLSFATW
jgi:hypothetical protein